LLLKAFGIAAYPHPMLLINLLLKIVVRLGITGHCDGLG